MPNRLRKQTRLRLPLIAHDRICKRGFNKDVAVVKKPGRGGTPHLIRYWANGPDTANDADAFRLVYRATTPFEIIDRYTKRCFYEADIYSNTGGAPIGELRVRRWYVAGRPPESILFTVSLNGAVVYQAEGM